MSETTVTQATAETAPAPSVTLKTPRFRTSRVANPDFVPPANFKFPLCLAEVPINPMGPTQIPYKLNIDYDKIDYKYKHLLPYNTLTAEPPLAPYQHIDAASRADPEKKSLLSVIPKKREMTPNIGTEVWGVQLSELTDQQLDELALWTAERGVVVFRDQDFVDRGADWMTEFGSYFGRLHVHQWGLHPRDQPELNIVYRDSDTGSFLDIQKEGMLNTLSWHTDMSYEV